MREGYCCVCTCVCVCVYLSVCYRSSCFSVRLKMEPTILTGLFYAFLGFVFVDFRKTLPFKSYSVKKPICKLVRAHREPSSRTFGTNGGLQLPKAQLVGRMLLQRLATGATGVKQVRYTPLCLPSPGATRYVRACAVYEVLCCASV